MPRSTAALIRRDSRLLFVRRPPGGDLSECWELPGGKVDAGESPPQALRRELREELGLEASVGPVVGRAEFRHHGKRFELLGYEVQADLRLLVLREHDEYAYYTVPEALELRLAPSDASLLRAIADVS